MRDSETMAEKKPFVEPKILADTDLETVGKDFPLMPMLGGSGPVLNVSDGGADPFNTTPDPNPL